MYTKTSALEGKQIHSCRWRCQTSTATTPGASKDITTKGDEHNTHFDTHNTSFDLGQRSGESSDLWVAYDGNGRVGKGDAHMYFYLLSFDRSGR
jgi:hypothetical protein